MVDGDEHIGRLTVSANLSQITLCRFCATPVTREHATIAEIHITPLDNMVLRLLITPWPSISIRNLSYAYFDRGKAREAQYEYDLAIKDYAEAIKRGPTTTSAVLRLYVARAHTASNSAEKELEENANRLGPVIN
jgi:tetratricopeptide (TPR) repeat protein